MKILSVFGTRPEAIKMAPIVRELKSRTRNKELRSVVCVSAQHRQMLDQVLTLFEIRPDYDLNIMQNNQSLSQVTANALTRLDNVIENERPDWVLVQGDTTTAMVAALVAFYHRIKVGHVEAGLRTWDKFRPFPEEINRKIADSLCDMHFAPTETARRNLLREGINDQSIRVTGNTVIDALQWVAALLETRMPEVGGLDLIDIEKSNSKLILVTAHRRENFGTPFEHIFSALGEIARRYGRQVHIVYPVHLNPNVQEPAIRLLSQIPNVTLLAPLDYFQFVHIMKRAYLVVTDSGGIQEEAPGLGKPVLVLRETTERPEAVEAGTVKLIGTEQNRIVTEISQLLENQHEYEQMARAVNPYGDGHAAERIVDVLLA